MYIEEFITPAMACSGVSIGSVVRKGNVLLCESDDVDIERIMIEFEDEEIAQDFERALENNAARIIIDEDTSLDAAPEELRNEYLLCEAAGNQERLEELHKELWEEYGIHPDKDEPRKTSGIKRIAVMHDTGVSAYGFRGMESALREWMKAHGFPVTDWNLRVC
ncbi:MAG: hypothetical protein LV481_16360 [Methylacidiphilales bacterium]|nr:hypothetical protein [Candidatus Methylacidiphilales bacterium]